MAKHNLYAQLQVVCPSKTYPIYIGHDLLSDPTLLCRPILGPQVLVVTNETIAPLYLNLLENAYSSKQCNVVILKDGEQHKNEHGLFTIYDTLIEHHHQRDTTIVALGGGVVGDMAGFAASTYQRGVNYIQIPTTLLSQVDSSVGGKTAINHRLGKNMIGSFYQPAAVIIDLSTLTTLKNREFVSGLAEVIKYGLLQGGEFLDKLTEFLSKKSIDIVGSDFAALVSNCCQIKANIIQLDEKEQGCRALLNLGHTFAHALEAYTQYARWLHGEAVAIGLYCAALLSYQCSYLNRESLDLVELLLNNAGLPHKIPRDIDLDRLQAFMFHDKKIHRGALRFVLLKAPGDSFLDSHITMDRVKHALNSAVKGEFNE